MALELDDRQRAMLREMGVHVWLAPAAAPTPAPEPSRVAAVHKLSQPTPPGMREPATATDQHAQTAPAEVNPPNTLSLDWPALAHAAAQCQACALCENRKNGTLQGQSQQQADWFVLGDPPDEDEDRLGQAFVGPPGVLLDNMLAAVGARRGGRAHEGAYVSNVVKCRAPYDRVAQWEEMQKCAPYLEREIALVRPRVILAMGRLAAQWLLQEHPQHLGLPLGKQRGTVYHYRGIPVVVTYDPRALLRTSANKAKAWDDLCMAMEVLEGPTPSVQ